MIEGQEHPAWTSAGPTERPGSALARFWAARGHSVFDAGGTLWVRQSRLYHVSVPYQTAVDVAHGALTDALRRSGVVAARYPTTGDEGVASGVFVCFTRGYGLHAVSRSHRSQVRRGLEACEIRRVPPEVLRTEGFELNRAQLARQRRDNPEFTDAARWSRFVAAVEGCPEVEVTGAFVDGRLSAYQVECRDGGWIHSLYKASRTEDLWLRTNPALEFSVLARAASDPTIVGVTNGILPLRTGRGDDHYKRGMGYRVVPQTVSVQLHPALERALANRWGAAGAAALARLRPTHRWREIAAVLRAAARCRSRPASRPGAGP